MQPRASSPSTGSPASGKTCSSRARRGQTATNPGPRSSRRGPALRYACFDNASTNPLGHVEDFSRIDFDALWAFAPTVDEILAQSRHPAWFAPAATFREAPHGPVASQRLKNQRFAVLQGEKPLYISTCRPQDPARSARGSIAGMFTGSNAENRRLESRLSPAGPSTARHTTHTTPHAPHHKAACPHV